MTSDADPSHIPSPAEGGDAPLRPDGHPGDRIDQPDGPRVFSATVHDSCGPVATITTAHKIPAGELQFRWRTCGLDLATPGRMEVIHDVSALGDALVSLYLCRVYAMPVDQLIDVVLARSALQPSASQGSPRLRSMAALAGVDPATLIRWHLAAGGLLPELASLTGGQAP